jgi:2-polyprenyl-6-methoxyphenol hydroxylase-like FAD-dependent oxidoreductase
MADIEVPVLIAGGSLVGMTAAMLLGQHGVPSLTVEHHRGTAIHPRAAQCTQRTMEVFRSLGIEDAVMKRSEEQFVQDGGVVAVETLVGGVTAHYIANLNEGSRDASPCSRVFLSQNALEPLMKVRAEELGARLLFSTELVSFEQDDSGVTAVLRHRDSGAQQTVRAKYLIAADGTHSRIRERLGIRRIGHGSFSRSITIYFRAPLRSLVEGKPWAVVYVNHPQLRGFFRFERPFESAFLVVNTAGDPAKPQTDVQTGLTPERAIEFVQTALGTRDIPIVIDNIMNWEATADTAERFRAGRVFIAGDAAHTMPPTGGFGGNCGIHDAHNLVWKLGLVLNGTAGEKLLETYDAERRPAGVLTTEQAYTRYVLRTDPSQPRDGMQPLARDLNVETGYIYRSAAVLTESPDDGAEHLDPRETKGRPGPRSPHQWLTRNGARISTLDLFGRNFVLLCGPEASAWQAAATPAAAQVRIPLDEHRIGHAGLIDDSRTFCAEHGIEPNGCVLVRPDGIVAWRARNAEGASAQILATVLETLLCRN